METQRILVTGGAGFIGTNLVRITKDLSIVITTIDSCTFIINLPIRRSFETFQKNLSFLLMEDICVFC